MSVMDVVGGVVVVWGLAVGVLIGMCRAAAPKTDVERRFDDDSQMRAVSGTSGTSGMSGRDDCPPHGIDRPSDDTLRRAGLL